MNSVALLPWRGFAVGACGWLGAEAMPLRVMYAATQQGEALLCCLP